MSARNFKSYTDGTSALKMPRWVQSPDEAAIIAFPTSCRASTPDADRPSEDAQAPVRAHDLTLRGMLESSEMYYSLRFEDALGCPYHLFTRKGIALLSSGAALIGVLSLILGA